MSDERPLSGPSETAPREELASAPECSERAEFEARRNAAMPARHQQRLRNLQHSADALQRLGHHVAFQTLFAQAQHRADLAPWLSRRCDCNEAQTLRAIGSGELPLPDVTLWATLNEWIQQSAVARLRQASHALSAEDDDGHWTRVAQRSTYDELEAIRNTHEIPAWAVRCNAQAATRRGEA